jgi:hypothetical protein
LRHVPLWGSLSEINDARLSALLTDELEAHVMRPVNSLTLEAIIELVSQAFAPLPDPRRPDRVDSSLHDTLMSGFAMMFFQSPNLLELQRKMRQRRHQCNLETIFGVREVPSDTQMRDILDGVSVELMRPLLPAVFEKIRCAGWAKEFTTTLSSGADQGTYYTLMLDGSDYFHSTRLQCPSCLQRHDSAGEVNFRHTVVSGTLVKAGSHRVLPIDVAEVRNDDGQDKQDCESKAAKRLILRLRQEHPQLALIIGGDDLYCHEPFIGQLREHRMHHVLVCKPGSHAEVYREVETQDALGALERGKWPRTTFDRNAQRSRPCSWTCGIRPCVADDAKTSLNYWKGLHRQYMRMTNLVERAYKEERRHTQFIPHL